MKDYSWQNERQEPEEEITLHPDASVKVDLEWYLDVTELLEHMSKDNTQQKASELLARAK